MKKVVHPECCGCGTLNPQFISERFPSIRVCYVCLTKCAGYLRDRGCLVSNPLTQELFDGVFSGGTVPLENQYTVIVKSEIGNNSFSYLLIDRVPELVEK